MGALGYTKVGSGEKKVLVLHNWFGDSSSYNAIIPYLDIKKFTYVFMDLRGYGKSKEIAGDYTVEEAAKDAMVLADSLSWKKFHLMGHSMSGMVAQKIAVDNIDRIKSVIAITPVPACGSPAPPEVMSFLEEAALDNDVNAQASVSLATQGRYLEQFTKNMVISWRKCSLPQARLSYLKMFSFTDFSGSVKGLRVPMLILSGEYDFEGANAMQKETFLKWYPNAKIIFLKASGHFPMIETPVYLATVVEQFLLDN